MFCVMILTHQTPNRRSDLAVDRSVLPSDLSDSLYYSYVATRTHLVAQVIIFGGGLALRGCPGDTRRSANYERLAFVLPNQAAPSPPPEAESYSTTVQPCIKKSLDVSLIR